MNTKITSMQQVLALHEGDTIKKYPTPGLPESVLDDQQQSHLETFTLRTINKKYSMLGLVMTEESRPQFPSPGDIGRQFISNSEIIAQDIWWLSDSRV
jgi:hypothetical protein